MISLSLFKDNLLAFMRLMIKTPESFIDVVYKGRLYRITVEDLNIDMVQRRRSRKRSLVDQVDAKKCPQCKKLMLNNVCMSSICPSRLAS